MTFDIEMIKKVYGSMKSSQENARKVFGRPVTLAEKILFSHLCETPTEAPIGGKSYVNLNPDRVAMQDATAQMALLQFMHAGKKTAAVPSSVHADHLLQAKLGAKEDLAIAQDVNSEVYNFLSSVSKKYGIGFWGAGSGIIHQIVFENYAFPGGMVIGTDSHTPNAGGLGMIAIGVGGADAVDVMAGMPWELKWPKLIGIKLTGKLSGWAAAKDVILKIAGILTVKGGTGAIVEYFGEGVESLSTTGKATITNMGAEIGATTSIFPYDNKAAEFLKITGRADIAELANANAECLKADEEVIADPAKYYDQVVEINLSDLEPHMVGPFTPDLDRPISAMKAEAAEKNYPTELKVGLIGSCTNSSYEDLSRAANIAQSAMDKGLKAKALFYISPGSEQIRATIERDGILKTLEDFGGVVLTNSCGPCIGQWDRQDYKEEKPNSIITSFNRNFRSRNDGNPETLAFIGSPELVTALTIAGRIDFNPMADTLTNEQGQEVSLDEPVGIELPTNGFIPGENTFIAPIDGGADIDIEVKLDSKRLQLLATFKAWNQEDTTGKLPILLKAVGKCTTDHISPAGKWLKFRGHLDNISDNMYIGANNAYTDKPGTSNNITTNATGTVSEIARQYKADNVNWVVIGDENYGEGSSREHAAMEPRFLGASAVIVRSFARIAETNLKKQGVLALTFADSAIFDSIEQIDKLEITGLSTFAPGSELTLKIEKADGSIQTTALNHSFSENQIQWFKAGSALNHIKSQA